MGLAPRNYAPSDKTRATNASATGKAAQRGRKASAQSLDAKAHGQAQGRINNYPQLDWSTVEDDVVLIADVAGKITQSQMGANGLYSMTVYVPKAYAHAIVEAALQQEGGLTYMRLYRVPISLFIDAYEAEQEAKEGAKDGEHTAT